MNKITKQHGNRILLFTLVAGLIAIIWLLIIPGLRYTSNSYAQSKDQAMSANFYYKEPTIQMEDMKLVASSNLGIITNNIQISGVDAWRGRSPLYIFALHYVDLNVDDVERRFVFVIKTNLGDPWFVADVPVKDPEIVSDTDRTIWFLFDVDKSILLSNPKIRPSWFDEAATSIIEVGVTDESQINVAGPGTLSDNEKEPLALIKIEDISIFP